MFLFGITGGIGMGKSAAGELLRRRQIPVVDTDTMARTASAKGTPAFQEITGHFGGDVVGAAGELNRRRLAEIVFNDPAARARLESILHPRIANAWRSQVKAWRQSGTSMAAVIIPLLFEKGYEPEFDTVICLACSAESQTQRLRQRGWSDEQIRARNAAQLSLNEKMARASQVIWTEGSMEVHQRQWDRILPRS
jgi:dephospho-CoA kinase